METDQDITIYDGLIIVVLSYLGFQLINKMSDIVVPTYTTFINKQQRWRFKNIFVSWVHSLITGIWAVLCFYTIPDMAEDLINTYNTFSVTLVAVSIGYFFYDVFDMLYNNRARQSYELIFHHIVVIFCFGITVTTHVYVGYAVVALLVELNGIFLHTRQILQICGFSKENKIYRLNSLVNIGTFVGFRILTLTWMTRWLVYNRDVVPFKMYTIGSVGMAIVTVMNIILFLRLLKSDFFRQKKETASFIFDAKNG